MDSPFRGIEDRRVELLRNEGSAAVPIEMGQIPIEQYDEPHQTCGADDDGHDFQADNPDFLPCGQIIG